MKILLSWHLYFKRYCKLKFKNKAKFCMQICPIFAGRVTYVARYASGIHSLQMGWLENMTLF